MRFNVCEFLLPWADVKAFGNFGFDWVLVYPKQISNQIRFLTRRVARFQEVRIARPKVRDPKRIIKQHLQICRLSVMQVPSAQRQTIQGWHVKTAAPLRSRRWPQRSGISKTALKYRARRRLRNQHTSFQSREKASGTVFLCCAFARDALSYPQSPISAAVIEKRSRQTAPRSGIRPEIESRTSRSRGISVALQPRSHRP